jgi:hypothetical protein
VTFIDEVSKLFDVLKAAPLARLGYHQYTHITQVWDMKMPFMSDDTRSGDVLAGSIGNDTRPLLEADKVYDSEHEGSIHPSR